MAFEKVKEFLRQCSRVLKVTKKPTKEEFKIIVKVSALGMLVIGLIGFVLHVLWLVIFPSTI